MKMLLNGAAVLLTLNLATYVHAAETDWLPIASDDESEWSFKSNSGDNSVLDGKYPIARAIVKAFDKKTSKSQFIRFFVKHEDCDAGIGTLYQNDLEGNFLRKGDYVKGGGTWGSAAGEGICEFYAKTKAEDLKNKPNQKKSKK